MKRQVSTGYWLCSKSFPQHYVQLDNQPALYSQGLPLMILDGFKKFINPTFFFIHHGKIVDSARCVSCTGTELIVCVRVGSVFYFLATSWNQLINECCPTKRLPCTNKEVPNYIQKQLSLITYSQNSSSLLHCNKNMACIDHYQNFHQAGLKVCLHQEYTKD